MVLLEFTYCDNNIYDMKTYIDFVKSLILEKKENIDVDNDNYSSYKGIATYQKRKEDFINSIKTFDDLTDDKIRECLSYFGYEGFNTEEEAFDDLKEKVWFYQKMPNPVLLYRVVGLKNKKVIDTKELGQHYTPHKWNIDGDTLMSIGYENWESDVKPYIMEVLVPLSEIDILQTIIQNLSFPNEHEINLKNSGAGAKFVKAYKLKGF